MSSYIMMFYFNSQIAVLGGFVMAIGFLIIIVESPLLFVINYLVDPAASFTIPISGSFAGLSLLLVINCNNRNFGTGRSVLNAINGGLTGMVSISIEK